MDITGLGDILVNLYLKMREDKELQAWIRLFASIALTAVIAFCGTAGPALANGTRPPISIGIGLTAVAACIFGLCVRSPLTRALMLEVPKQVVENYQDHPDSVNIAGKDAEKK